jgi:hypothetical protein
MIPKKPVLGLNPRMDTSFRKKTAIARQPLGWIKTQKNCGKAKLWNLPALVACAAMGLRPSPARTLPRNEGSGTDLHVIFLS